MLQFFVLKEAVSTFKAQCEGLHLRLLTYVQAFETPFRVRGLVKGRVRGLPSAVY